MRSISRLRALAVAATSVGAIALTTGSAFAGTAPAVTHPASCGWINIGLPGNFYLYGSYAGQVEQQYNTCDGTVHAHWQWSTAFRNANPKAVVGTWVESYTRSREDAEIQLPADVTQDVYSGGINIHTATPDTWVAIAWVEDANKNSCGTGARGDYHVYATGGTLEQPSPGGC